MASPGLAFPIAPRVIGIAAGKGGVGKTTVAVNLAAALARRDWLTLLVDGGMALPNVDLLLGLLPPLTLAQVLAGECTLDEAIIPGPQGIQVLAAHSGDPQLATLDVRGHAALVHAFSTLQLPVEMMLLDTAGGLADGTLALTAACHSVLVVLTNDPGSLANAYAVVKALNTQHGTHQVHVVTNMVSSRSEGNETFNAFARMVAQFLNVAVFNVGIIPEDLHLKAATRNQKTIFCQNPEAPSAKAFETLARAIETWAPARASGHLEFFTERLLAAE